MALLNNVEVQMTNYYNYLIVSKLIDATLLQLTTLCIPYDVLLTTRMCWNMTEMYLTMY